MALPDGGAAEAHGYAKLLTGGMLEGLAPRAAWGCRRGRPPYRSLSDSVLHASLVVSLHAVSSRLSLAENPDNHAALVSAGAVEALVSAFDHAYPAQGLTMLPALADFATADVTRGGAPNAPFGDAGVPGVLAAPGAAGHCARRPLRRLLSGWGGSAGLLGLVAGGGFFLDG